ncbi:MAG: fatty acid desaturase [Sedimentitalea sp.]
MIATDLDETPQKRHRVEWITLAMIVLCYASWAAVVFGLWTLAPGWSVLALAVILAFHSSLSHEALHGHPFAARWANEALMALPVGLAVPYNRFRDLHLDHHRDANLTDPYDDPESNYLDPAVWSQLARWHRWVLRVNNTLAGRIAIGSAVGQVAFVRDEWQAARRSDRAVWLAWALHLAGVVVVLALIAWAGMAVWAYLISAYLALSLLRIRTFLEHRAHEKSRGRSVIIEDRGVLAFLFLNNNFHAVHHMNPTVPWYALPGLYRAGKARYCALNDGYIYRSYGQIFRTYFWRAKDPVAHPLWPEG